MDQYEFIRTAHRAYGKNISELARMTGHSRNTVKKALRGEPWGYSERKKQPFPVLGQYVAIIDGWLKEDRDVPKKQRHTARRIYHRLVAEHGYKGGESTVRRYVSMAKMRLGRDRPGAFIPCDPEAGFEAEVDWGTATAEIGGTRQTIKIFCMRSKYSGKHFVRAYPCERQQAFFDAHLHGFQFFGGARPIRQWRSSWPACYDGLLQRFQQHQGETAGIKDFITVLTLHRHYTSSEVETAVELALEQGLSSSEGVRHLLIYANEPPVTTTPLDGWESIAPADVRQYGQLGGVQ